MRESCSFLAVFELHVDSIHAAKLDTDRVTTTLFLALLLDSLLHIGIGVPGRGFEPHAFSSA